jgi:hypothetical protein
MFLNTRVTESSRTVIVTAPVIENERGGQGHISASLLHQSATWLWAVNMRCLYTNAFFDFMFRFVYDGWQDRATCLRHVLPEDRCILYRNTLNFLWGFWINSLSRTAVCEWYSRLKAGRVSVGGDQAPEIPQKMLKHSRTRSRRPIGEHFVSTQTPFGLPGTCAALPLSLFPRLLTNDHSLWRTT